MLHRGAVRRQVCSSHALPSGPEPGQFCDRLPGPGLVHALAAPRSETGFSYRKCIDATFEKAVRELRGQKRGRDDWDAGESPAKRPMVRMETMPGVVVTVEGLKEETTFREVKEFFGACGNVKCAASPRARVPACRRARARAWV